MPICAQCLCPANANRASRRLRAVRDGAAGADVYVPKDIDMAIAQQFSFACPKKVTEPENMQAACSCHRPLPAKLPLAGAAEKV